MLVAVRMEGTALRLVNVPVLLSGLDQHVTIVQPEMLKMFTVLSKVPYDIVQLYVNMNVKMEEPVVVLTSALALLDGVETTVQ